MTPRDPTPGPSGPLSGLRVLDFGAFLAGSYNAVLMGDMGADVIKVESPGGDPTRTVGPFLDGESRIFIGWNRNKRSLVLDLRKDEGREVAYDLVKTADVVTANFRPGVATKLKIDYDVLSALNPRIICCNVTGYGSHGPMAHLPSYDAILQAMGGIAFNNGRAAGKPITIQPVFVDLYTAMLALSAILAALHHRHQTGEGQFVETSLLQGVMAVQPAEYCRALEKEEERAAGAYPYVLYDTKEGTIFVGATQNHFWKAFCEALEDADLGENPRYRDNADRIDNALELHALLQPMMLEKTAREWEAILNEKGIPNGVVQTNAEFFENPQVKAMDMNPVIQHSSVGPVRVFGVPFNFSKTPGRIQRAAPRYGEHTQEILMEIGYDKARIDALKNDKIVFASA